MSAVGVEFAEAIEPTEADARLAQESGGRLADLLGQGSSTVGIHVQVGDAGEGVAIPVAAAKALASILQEMGKGNAVALLPLHSELTMQQAADVLNVSHSFLSRLLDEGTIQFRGGGAHRRVLLRDVLEYKRQIDHRRLATLEDLAAQAQELGMGY